MSRRGLSMVAAVVAGGLAVVAPAAPVGAARERSSTTAIVRDLSAEDRA